MTTQPPVNPTGTDVAVAALEAVLQLYHDSPDGSVCPEREYGIMLWAALRAAYPKVLDHEWRMGHLSLNPAVLADAADLLMQRAGRPALATAAPVEPEPVSRAVVQAVVDRAIRQHELRVAVVSGLLGLALLAGTWHAIWLTAGNAQ